MPVQRQFYRDIYQWITKLNCGLSIHGFKKTNGLCANYDNWTIVHKKKKRSMGLEFITAGLESAVYPFNAEGKTFSEEVYENKVYKNPLRLKWIKDHC